MAERSGDTAFYEATGTRKRRGASLPAAVQNVIMIRVVLPYHLRNLARVDGEVQLEVASPATVRSVLDALEARYPVLRGAIRDHVTKKRRAFVRFFACEQDLSHDPPDSPLPDAVATGNESFIVLGAMAGG